MTAQQLKNSILQMAVSGKLVPQDPNDEPASVLLERIKAEKEELIKAGKIKKDKKSSEIFRGTSRNIPYAFCEQVGKEVRDISDEIPFEIPESWVWSHIGGVAFVTKLAGFEYTESIFPNLSSSGIPLFKGKNVQNGKLVFEFESYISEQLSDELFRSQINRKCLLTPYVGTIGNIAIFDGSFKAHLGSNVGKIELLNPVSPVLLEEYVLYYLRSQAGYEQLTKHKKATAQESISIENIRGVLLPIPPIEEQHRIVAKIEELLPYIDKYEQAETQLTDLNNNFPELLKKSILQEAVQGKLVPQDPNDEPVSVLLERIRAEKQTLIKAGKIKKDKHESAIVTLDKIPYIVPEDWVWCRLSDLALKEIKRGRSPVYAEKGVTLVFAQKCNVKNGSINLNLAKFLDDVTASKYPEEEYILSNDIIINSTGTGTVVSESLKALIILIMFVLCLIHM